MAELASLLGEAMIPGMLATAGFNAVMAGTFDYSEKCSRVGNYQDAINQFNGFNNQMTAKWSSLLGQIDYFNQQLTHSTSSITQAIDDSNISNQKTLHRTRITTAVITGFISLLLMMKLYLKQI